MVGLKLWGSVSSLAVALASPAVAQTTPEGAAPVEAAQDGSAGRVGIDPSTSDPQTESSTAPIDQAASTGAGPGDIIVTANRREERLSRVGITVTAVGAAEIASQGIDDPEDLVRVVPGFQATTSYGGAPNYTLRGVGFTARYAAATAPIGLYLNEAAVPYPYMSLGLLFDLERVEALKGPQGTLYGRNATGGLLNFVTAKPTSTLQSGVSFEVGNYQSINVNAFASGPLADGVLVRLAVDTQNRNRGWQRSVTRGERLGELNQHAARLSLALGDGGGPFNLSLVGNYWKRDGDTQAPQAIFFITGASPFANPAARASIIADPRNGRQADFLSVGRQPSADVGILHPAPLVDSEYFDVTARAALEVADGVSLVSLTSYNDLDQRDVSDGAGLQTESIYQDSQNKIRSFSQELRAVGEGDRFNWSLGGYYADDKARVFDLGYADENAVIGQLRFLAARFNRGGFTPQAIARSFINYQNRAVFDTSVLAVFGNADYRFSDVVKLSLGGRYTRDKNAIDACTYDTDGGNVPVITNVYPLLVGVPVTLAPNQCYVLTANSRGFVDGTVRRSQTQKNFSWRANVDITPNDETLFYATISRGYKAGGFPILAASNEVQFEPVRQEKLTSYEVGTKLNLFDRSLQFNLSAFYYDYVDKQIFGRVSDIVFGTLTRIDNIDESREYGVEAEATLRIASYLTLRAAGVYLDSKIEEYQGFDEFGVATDFQGRPFAYTPKFQGNASANVDAPIGGDLRFQASANVNYQTKSRSDFAGSPLFRIKGYAVVGATLGIASDEGFTAGLYARNLFNKYYWTGVGSATETVFRYAGMPREYGVRAAFRF